MPSHINNPGYLLACLAFEGYFEADDSVHGFWVSEKYRLHNRRKHEVNKASRYLNYTLRACNLPTVIQREELLCSGYKYFVEPRPDPVMPSRFGRVSARKSAEGA